MNLDLVELRARMLKAHANGHRVAYAAEYVADLGGGPIPDDVEPFSAQHVLYLIERIENPPPLVVEPAPVAAPTPKPVVVEKKEPAREPEAKTVTEPTPEPAPTKEPVAEEAPADPATDTAPKKARKK